MLHDHEVTIGVLALQGDVREHLAALEAAGAQACAVRRPEELDDVDGLVIPGGESTTMGNLAETFNLMEPMRKLIVGGLPVFGSCAGMIMLADRVADGAVGQQTFGGIDVTVRRNAFGRQVDSFEADLDIEDLDGGPFHAVFIRAPWVEEVGDDVRVLARVPASASGDEGTAGRIVAIRQGERLATSFHPELTGDDRLHRLFVAMVRERKQEA